MKIQSNQTILDIWYLVDWSVTWWNMHSKYEGVGLSSNELMWPLQYDYTLQSRTVMWPLHYIYTLHGLRVSVTLLASHSTHIMKGQPFLEWKNSLIFFKKLIGLNIFFSIPFFFLSFLVNRHLMFPTLGLAPGYSLTVMKAARKFKELVRLGGGVAIGQYQTRRITLLTVCQYVIYHSLLVLSIIKASLWSRSNKISNFKLKISIHYR